MYTIGQLRRQFEALKRKYARRPLRRPARNLLIAPTPATGRNGTKWDTIRKFSHAIRHSILYILSINVKNSPEPEHCHSPRSNLRRGGASGRIQVID